MLLECLGIPTGGTLQLVSDISGQAAADVGQRVNGGPGKSAALASPPVSADTSLVKCQACEMPWVDASILLGLYMNMDGSAKHHWGMCVGKSKDKADKLSLIHI